MPAPSQRSALGALFFVLAAFGVDIGADVALGALGLAFFAAGHLV